MVKNRITVDQVKNLYDGRSSPSRKQWLGNHGEDLQKPQFPEDQHGKNYSNEVPMVRRVGNQTIGANPCFDKSPARQPVKSLASGKDASKSPFSAAHKHFK
jgi:hypothetical protein